MGYISCLGKVLLALDLLCFRNKYFFFFNEILNEIEKYSSLQTKLRIERAVVFDYTHTVKILLKKVWPP